MGWKVVEVNTDEHLKLYLNNLMITRINEKILININDIDTLILHNSRTNISVKLLNWLTYKNVNIIFFNELHEPQSHVFPFNGNHRSLKIFNEQLKWNNHFKGNNWQKIIQNKIHSQMSLLIKLNKINENDNPFLDFKNNVKVFDITNREGHAAKVYWHSLFGIKFIRDQKAHQFPIINAMLNYGYAILRSLVIRSIIKKGLDPRISFFHKSFTNFFALASDLMEPLRPLVDEIIYEHRDAKIFTVEIREKLVNVINQKIKFEEKKFYLYLAIDYAIDTLVRQELWKELKLWD